jgi:hypothetical protein
MVQSEKFGSWGIEFVAGRLKSLTHNLHSVLSNLLTWAEIRSLRGRTNMNSRVAPLRSSALHLPFLLHDPSSVFKD